MHYALSHREDTKYWKDISNKSFLKNTIAQDKDFELNISAKMNSGLRYRNDSGIHCISTGMRYFGIDVLAANSNDHDKRQIYFRNDMVKEWNTDTKDKLKLIDYLKKNIHASI
jgi:hypothetical protein